MFLQAFSALGSMSALGRMPYTRICRRRLVIGAHNESYGKNSNSGLRWWIYKSYASCWRRNQLPMNIVGERGPELFIPQPIRANYKY